METINDASSVHFQIMFALSLVLWLWEFLSAIKNIILFYYAIVACANYSPMLLAHRMSDIASFGCELNQ